MQSLRLATGFSYPFAATMVVGNIRIDVFPHIFPWPAVATLYSGSSLSPMSRWRFRRYHAGISDMSFCTVLGTRDGLTIPGPWGILDRCKSFSCWQQSLASIAAMTDCNAF